MTVQHHAIPTLHQAEATASQFQAVAARIAAHLAGAPGELARDDIAWLWTELEQCQRALAARDADLQRAQDALQMSEARLNLIQEGVDAGVWDWEPQADSLTVTAQVESLHGLPSGAIQPYQDWRQRIHPDDVERVETERDAAIAEHRAFAIEFRVDAGDGETRWILGRGRAIYREDGQVVRVVGINQDITERKRAELALLAERANMQALLENTDGSIWSVDTNYCLIAGNSVFYRDTRQVFGEDFTVGASLLVRNGSPDAMAVWKSRYDRALRGETFTVETQRLFGEPFWVEYRFSPIRDVTGAITGVTVFGRDITKRKQAEQQIRAQLAEITFYYDNAPIGLTVLDTNLRFMRINKLLAEANGVPAADHIGRTVEEIIPDLAAQGHALAARILATGEPITEIEISGETAARPGVMRYWREGWYPVKGDDQVIIAFSVIAQEITERKLAEDALRIAQQHLAEHIDNSPLAVIEFDPAFRLIRWSQGAVRMFGWRPEEVLGKTISELSWVYDEDGELVRQTSEAMFAGRSTRNLNVNRNYRKDGAVIHCAWYNSAIYDDGGSLVSILSQVLDITERVRAEANLRQSQQSLMRAQQLGHLGNWEWDVPGARLTWSEELYRIFGVDHTFPLTYDRIEAMLHPEDRALNAAKVQEALSAGDVVEYEFRIIRPGGALRWIRQGIEIERDPTGAPTRLFGVMHDITQRRLAEETLRRSQHNLAEAQRIGHSGSWEYDVVAQRATWSDNMFCIYDVDPTASTAQAFMDNIEPLIHPEDRSLVRAAFDAAVQHGQRYALEYRIVRRDGDVRTLYSVAEIMLDEQGKTTHMIGRVEDITERKRAEAERERLQAQLAEAQKMETVGRLAGGVAHEFNNLLAVILLRTEMSLSLVEPMSILHRNLTTILATTQRSAELVRQLLGFARKQMIDPKVLDLNAVIEATLPMLHKLVGEEIKLVWQQEAFLWPIKMDQTQIDQILANLCVNACDAIDGAGAITIETSNVTMTQDEVADTFTEAAGDYVLLSVTDTGHGMDLNTLAHVFEPFFTTKEVGKGTGLGLPMVKGIMQQNHGHIQVFSEPNRGTTIKLYFPRHAEALPSAAPSQPPTLPVGQRETVLLVEDEPILLQMSSDVLEFLGYVVIAAATPQEALQAVEDFSGKIDLVMTDIVMPEMNGVELVARLTVTHPGIKRLFVSGYSADYIAHRGILEDDVHFLQKPYTLQALAAKLREVLDGTGYAVAPYSRV